MSLKSIELQQVLPKSLKVGKVQNGIHHQLLANEAFIISENKKIEQRNMKRTVKTKKSTLNENNSNRDSKNNVNEKGQYIDIHL